MSIVNVNIKNTSGIEDGSDAHPYSKIQKAVDAASSGDIVHVQSGKYSEHVTIGKSLVLEGDDKDTTTIDGSGSGKVIHITANHVTISGFKLTNGEFGIYLIPNWAIHHVTIANSIITSNSKSGIIAAHSLSAGAYHVFEDCIISNNSGGGFYGHQFSKSIIRNCKVFGNVGTALNIGWGPDTLVTNNEVFDNTGAGIRLDSMRYTIVEKNHVYSNGGGINVAYVGRHNTIRDNIVFHNSNGITMGGPRVYGNKIYHNDIKENTRQAHDAEGDNTWDNGAMEGNFWSDYTGDDTNGNDVGDTKVPHLGLDSYPMMIPFEMGILSLPIVDVMGVGKVYSEKLEANGVNTIADMVSVDVSTLSESTDISLYKLYMWKRRAVLAMDVKIDPDLFRDIQKIELGDIITLSDEELSSKAHQPIEIIPDLKKDISALFISLDNDIVKSMTIESLAA